jgi:hypothetical protein
MQGQMDMRKFLSIFLKEKERKHSALKHSLSFSQDIFDKKNI